MDADLLGRMFCQSVKKEKNPLGGSDTKVNVPMTIFLRIISALHQELLQRDKDINIKRRTAINVHC